MQFSQTTDLLALLAAVPIAALGGGAFLQGVVGVAVGFGLITLLLVLPRRGMLSRARGFALLVAYAAFVAVTAALAG